MNREPTFENALAFAGDLIRIPSMSGEEGEVAARLQDEMRVLGFDRVEVDGLGSVAGVVKGRGDAPPVMLSCHLDVVAEGAHEEWEHPPFCGDVVDGHLHGRGAMDIKGPMALQVYAAAALAGRSPGDVIVGQVVYEERGGWGMENLVRSGLVNPAAVIIGESTYGDIALGHRGRAQLEVVIRGLASHASAPDRARNALDLLPGVLTGVAALARRQESDPVLGPASLAPTDVRVRPESPNVIPDEVTVVLDWRILPTDTEASLIGRVEDAIAAVIRMFRPATRSSAASPRSARPPTPAGPPTATCSRRAFSWSPITRWSPRPRARWGAAAPLTRPPTAVPGPSQPTEAGPAACSAFPPSASPPGRNATRTPTANGSTSRRPAGRSAAIRRSFSPCRRPWRGADVSPTASRRRLPG